MIFVVVAKLLLLQSNSGVEIKIEITFGFQCCDRNNFIKVTSGRVNLLIKIPPPLVANVEIRKSLPPAEGR